jgi:nicotinamide-nucleotide amidase
MDHELVALSEAVRDATLAPYRHRRLLIATAESCTGGWAAQVITHTAGSSEWFERGFVTYSNEAKIDLLDVNTVSLTDFGAVSTEVAAEMAVGALRHSRADLSVSITGIAGPGGGSPDKPVGTVCFAWCVRDTAGNISVPSCERRLFQGDREMIRRTAVIHALNGLVALANSVP